MKRLFKKCASSILAVTAAALLVQNAGAAALTYTADDLFVAFRTTTTSGDSDLIVNLGSYTQLTSGTGSLSLDLSGYLTAAYGTNWASVSDLSFSIFGTVGGNGTLGPLNYTTWTTSDSPATNRTTLSAADSKMAAVYGNGNFTLVDANGGYVIDSDGNSYSVQASGTNYFGAANGGEVSVVSALTTTDDLTLFEYVRGNTPTAIGTKSILASSVNLDSSGTLTVSAVPEPSTYALMFLGASLLFWSMKRRNVSFRI